MTSHPRCGAPVICALTLWLTVPSAEAQTISQPANGARLKAGSDFATLAFADPWDMRNVEDVSQFPPAIYGAATNPMWQNGAGIDAGTGVWHGVTANGDAAVPLLFPGLPGGVHIPAGRWGVNTPIPADTFRKVTFKFYTATAGEIIGLHWFKDLNQTTNNGYHFLSPTTTGGWQVLSVTLSAGENWSGNVLGIRIDPNDYPGTVGMQFQLDWARLTAGDVTTPVTWSGGSGSTVVEAVDAAGVVVATIGTGAGGTVNWGYDGLPPGAYTIRLRTGGTVHPGAIGITVNDPPTIQLVHPSEAGGEDWATAVKGNAWDMADAGDLLTWGNIFGQTYTWSEGRSVFQAYNAGGDPSVTLVNGSLPGIDAAKYHRLTFRMKVNHAEPSDWVTTRLLWGKDPADPTTMSTSEDIMVWNNEYRDYTVDLATLTLTAGIEPGAAAGTWSGSVRQVRFDPLEYPDTNLFQIDEIRLAADDTTAANGTFQITWTATDADNAPTVALYYDTDRDPNNGMTVIATGLSASAGSYIWDATAVAPASYYIYAAITDGLNSQGRYSSGPVKVTAPAGPPMYQLTTMVYGGGSLALSPTGTSCGTGCTQYPAGTVVTLQAVPGGGYRFAGYGSDADCLDGYVVVGANTACSATFTAVATGPPTPGMADLNADRRGDAFLYNPATGAWREAFSNGAGTFSARVGTWDPPGWQVYAVDWTGNGITDFFVYNPTTGAWVKCLNDGAGNFTYVGGTASLGWQVVTGDFNGDRGSDVFLYNRTAGNWLTCFSTGADGSGFACAPGNWGGGWDIYPVDLDGDGAADLFAHNGATGQWRWCASNRTGSYTCLARAWNPRAWQIHTGDFNGDGRGDLFLFDVATGQWSIALNRGRGVFRYVTGSWSPNWTIKVGDFDGNGRDDLFAYSAGSGAWSECFFNGAGFDYASGGWSPGWQVFVTDLNGDGRSDVLTYSQASGVYYQCLNAAPGAFTYVSGTVGPGWTVIAEAAKW